MNNGLVFGDNKCIWVKNNGTSTEMEWDEKFELSQLLKNIEVEYYSTNQRCAVSFCSDVCSEQKMIILDTLQTKLGQIDFFVADSHKVILLGNYSIPRHRQPCFSLGDNKVQVFIFEGGEKHRESSLKLGGSNYLYKRAGGGVMSNKSYGDFDKYVFELNVDRLTSDICFAMLKLLETLDTISLSQGIIGFTPDSGEFVDVIVKIEQRIKMPVISMKSGFESIKKSMIELVNDNIIFEQVIKLSKA